ncbi:TadE/TadG family type IV pilus assembly protein [Rhizobium sp. AAP43]|uniref:TadE/TadG family type IV pilus assembly protein n=1 Tax=Rhizobium sp. AAP43 TaxID=1523420 RepID=UPI0006CC1A96|nr:TadE/TadG family type IV pilus assembly protein [Rhizobium sp. AAP43]KPF44504.1 hypothetical protein IP76_10670 [Rhizobium sp. AAP43]
MSPFKSSSWRACCDRLTDLWRDRQGVGAVEFALIAPMLLVVYLMAFELTIGLSISKKTSMAASTIGDLISREDKVTKVSLATSSDVAKAMFVPYPSKDLLIKITGIKIDDKEAAKVAWSWSSTGVAPYVVGSTPTIPSDLVEPSIFLVRTELSVSHELLMWLPGLTGSSTKTLTLGREFFFRQRLSKDIECSDC